MIPVEAEKLFKKATNHKSTGKTVKAQKVYESMLEDFEDEEVIRRTKIELLRVYTKLKLTKAEDLLEDIIMIEDLLPWEKNIIIIYYIEVLKAYELAEDLVDEVLLDDPENKTAGFLKQRILDHKFVVKNTAKFKRISKKDEMRMFKIIATNLYSKIDLHEVISMGFKISNIPNNVNKLLALLIVERACEILNMQSAQEYEAVLQKIKLLINGTEDKIAILRSIRYLEKALKDKVDILSLINTDYLMLFKFIKGDVKYKGEPNRIRISALQKINKNVLVFKTHGLNVYSIPFKNAGIVDNQVVNYITVVSDEINNDIKCLFPSIKVVN